MADLRQNLEDGGDREGLLNEGNNNSGELKPINDDGTNIDPAGSSDGHENDLISGLKGGKGGMATQGDEAGSGDEE